MSLQFPDMYMKFKIFQHNLQLFIDYFKFGQTNNLYSWIVENQFKIIFNSFYQANQDHFELKGLK